jgi:large subunit ribosomal protein L15
VHQHELRPPAGARHHPKRVGRGNASGHGTYSGRGLKGQKARAGGGVRASFEGGQLPLVRRMGRKRGFTNAFRVEYDTVNLSRLARFPAGSEVTPETLVSAGIIKDARKPLKVLGDGALKGPLTVRANKFSASARQKIEAAGGKVEELAHGSE